MPAMYYVHHQLLVDANNIILSPLRKKLGLFKNFVQGLPDDSAGFISLKIIQSSLTTAKVCAAIFTGDSEVIHNPPFKLQLQFKKFAANKAFVEVVQNFFGNHRPEDYVEPDVIHNFH